MIERLNLGRLKAWYEMNESKLSSGSLLLGFVIDSLTLPRIDNIKGNLWIAFNLCLVALCIVILNALAKQEASPRVQKMSIWLTAILQFSMGSTLGAFFIFYFRSATLVSAWPFMLLLLLVMISNELFQKKYAKLVSQISFLYFSIFLFLIFLVPLLTHHIGRMIFLLSGFASLLVIWMFLKVVRKVAPLKLERSRKPLTLSIAAIFLAMNILYFTNLIPPIPLSLKDAGIYHGLEVEGGNYLLSKENHGIWGYFQLRQRFHTSLGQDVYAYSSIFSPPSLDTQIVHQWQYKKDGEWVTESRILLNVSGGRGGGFRTFSKRSDLKDGYWRVNVKTVQGQLIGRINFKVVSSDTDSNLEIAIK